MRQTIEPAGTPAGAGEEPTDLRAEPRTGIRPLLDLAAIDRAARLHGPEVIERFIPHRGAMRLIDSVVWENPGYTEGIGLKHISAREFWVPGHFPGQPMMPGVLMIEAGAQMACYLYNRRRPEPKVVAFLRIQNASFRSMVKPGDDLLVLCKEVKFSRRRFISDIQGMVGDRITFDARITGMQL